MSAFLASCLGQLYLLCLKALRALRDIALTDTSLVFRADKDSESRNLGGSPKPGSPKVKKTAVFRETGLRPAPDSSARSLSRWCQPPSQHSSTFVRLERIRPRRSSPSLQKPRWRRVRRTRPPGKCCTPPRSNWNSRPRRDRRCAEPLPLHYQSTTPSQENLQRCSRRKDWQPRCRKSAARKSL